MFRLISVGGKKEEKMLKANRALKLKQKSYDLSTAHTHTHKVPSCIVILPNCALSYYCFTIEQSKQVQKNVKKTHGHKM